MHRRTQYLSLGCAVVALSSCWAGPRPRAATVTSTHLPTASTSTSTAMAPASSADRSGAAPSFDLQPRVRQFIDELHRGKFDEAAKRFAPEMAAAMSVADLQTTWAGIERRAGAFDHIEKLEVSKKGDLAAVKATCAFGREQRILRVIFRSNGAISGLWVTQPWSAPDYAKSDSFTEQDVLVGSAPQLKGILTTPRSATPGPAVVLVHGSGPNDEDETVPASGNKVFKDLAWGLASRGVSVLRYVKRSRQHPESQPRALTLDDDVTKDACSAVDLLLSTPGIDPKRIFIVGHSQGAGMAPRIAMKCPRVAGLVLLAGATRNTRALLRDQIPYLGALQGRAQADTDKELREMEESFRRAAEEGPPEEEFKLIGTALPRLYLRDELSYDPVAHARRARKPMLVLQGERDYQVPVIDFEGWKDGLKGRRDVSFKLYPSLNHHFMTGEGKPGPAEYATPNHVSAEVIEDVANWVSAKR